MKDINSKDSQILYTNKAKIKTEEIFSSFKFVKVKNKSINININKNNKKADNNSNTNNFNFINELNNKIQKKFISGESTTISLINTDCDKEMEKVKNLQQNLNSNSNNLLFDEENEGLNTGKYSIGLKQEDSRSMRNRYKIFNKIKGEEDSNGNISSFDLGNFFIYNYLYLF
jgi:hypothetical protein